MIKRSTIKTNDPEKAIRLYREAQFNKIKDKLHFHTKINKYLDNFDFANKIGDYKATFFTGNTLPENIIKQFLLERFEIIEAIKVTNKEVWYIIKNSIVVLFYGTEDQCYEKAVIQKAWLNKDIPHIVDGKIIGKVNKNDIMKIIIKYDREYGMLLLKYYEKAIFEFLFFY